MILLPFGFVHFALLFYSVSYPNSKGLTEAPFQWFIMMNLINLAIALFSPHICFQVYYFYVSIAISTVWVTDIKPGIVV